MQIFMTCLQLVPVRLGGKVILQAFECILDLAQLIHIPQKTHTDISVSQYILLFHYSYKGRGQQRTSRPWELTFLIAFIEALYNLLLIHLISLTLALTNGDRSDGPLYFLSHSCSRIMINQLHCQLCFTFWLSVLKTRVNTLVDKAPE